MFNGSDVCDIDEVLHNENRTLSFQLIGVLTELLGLVVLDAVHAQLRAYYFTNCTLHATNTSHMLWKTINITTKLDRFHVSLRKTKRFLHQAP